MAPHASCTQAVASLLGRSGRAHALASDHQPEFRPRRRLALPVEITAHGELASFAVTREP
jgi:hypothetical protein